MNCIPRISTLPTLEPGVTVLVGPTTEEAFMIAVHAYAPSFLKQFGTVTVTGAGGENWVTTAYFVIAHLLAKDFGIAYTAPHTLEKTEAVWSKLHDQHDIRVFNWDSPAAYNMCINIPNSVTDDELSRIHSAKQCSGDYHLVCLSDADLKGIQCKYPTLRFSIESEAISIWDKGKYMRTVLVRYHKDMLCEVSA